MRIGGNIGMKRRTEVRDACVAEQVQLDIVAFRNLIQQVIQIPADSGERLVKRPDVDADAERRLVTRRAAKCAPHSLGKRMAQSVNDGPDH